jgi:capsular polysaccharide transport system permease protein
VASSNILRQSRYRFVEQESRLMPLQLFSTTFAARLATQVRIIRALLIRDAQARYGGEGLGIFWVIAEPLMLTCGVILLWSITNRGEAAKEVGIVLFALTAYTHTQLWRIGVLSAILVVRREAWLYYHRNVMATDIIIARTVLTSLGVFTSFWVVYLMGLLFGIFGPPKDLFATIAAWVLDTLFVMSFAMFVAGLSEISDFVEKLIHPLMYLTLPLTGAFTMTVWLPARMRDIVSWSPLVQLCEMFRYGLFPEDIKTVWSVPFIVVSTLFFFAIGIPLVERGRRLIAVT